MEIMTPHVLRGQIWLVAQNRHFVDVATRRPEHLRILVIVLFLHTGLGHVRREVDLVREFSDLNSKTALNLIEGRGVIRSDNKAATVFR